MMWRTKQFWTTFVIYTIISIAICFALLFWIGIIAMGDDLGNDERLSMTAIPVFLLNYILGFPLGLFLYDDTMRWSYSLGGVLLLQTINCFIQLSILFFLWQKFKHKKPIVS
jgi:hypothetical protein